MQKKDFIGTSKKMVNFIQKVEKDSQFRETTLTNPAKVLSTFTNEKDKNIVTRVIEALKVRFAEESKYIENLKVFEQPATLAFRNR